MLVSPDYRVQLDDPNPVSTTPQLEAVFVGAAPFDPPPAAALQLTATVAAMAAARQLGFEPPLDGSLNGVPLAFSSTAAFAAVFPGDTSWLAKAVKDYFNAGGLRAWVVRIDSGSTPLLDSIAIDGVGIAVQIPAAGLVMVPDLEALCLASVPAPTPLPKPPPLTPAFRPLSGSVSPPPSSIVSTTLSTPAGLAATAIAPASLTLSWNAATDTGGAGVGGYIIYRNGSIVGTVDGAATRYGDSALSPEASYSYTVVAFDRSLPALISPPSAPLTVSTAQLVTPSDVLNRLSAVLAAQRPDMLCLFTLPVGADASLSIAKLVTRTFGYLGGDGTTTNFPQVQAFAPLLRDAVTGMTSSASGLIAGTLAASAEHDGVWRSIAGRVLPLGAMPLRRIESNALQQLRGGGVAVLRAAAGGSMLDDDILACVDGPGSALRRSGGGRRLMGWLLRNLQTFGEQLVFENVLDDGRVELVLYDLFATLLKRGALNGTRLTDAVTISRTTGVEGELHFDIAVAVAVAIEHIQLHFVDGELTASWGAAA